MATTPDPARHSAPESDQAQESASRQRSPEEAFASLRTRIEELIDYSIFYATSRWDALKLRIKRRIFIASMLAVSVLAAAGAIVTAVVLLAEGICDAFTVLLGHRWMGEVVTALFLLGLVAGSALFGVTRLSTKSHQRAVKKYDDLRRHQRERRGHDVAGQTGTQPDRNRRT